MKQKFATNEGQLTYLNLCVCVSGAQLRIKHSIFFGEESIRIKNGERVCTLCAYAVRICRVIMMQHHATNTLARKYRAQFRTACEYPKYCIGNGGDGG